MFCASRFVCTFLLRYMNPGKLLSALSVVAIGLLLVVVLVGGHAGLCCLVAVSACMSLMFPTIYGMSLEGVAGEDAKIGAAGLIMAILGGSLLPPLQARIIDLGTVVPGGTVAAGPAVAVGSLGALNLSFLLPLFCFVLIALYGWRHWRR